MAKKSKTQRAKASERRARKREEENLLVDGEAADLDQAKSEAGRKSAKAEKKAKKPGFFAEVRAEMKRVTWPTRTDVLRWSGVVVVALLFFSIFVLVLDNWIVTPFLVGVSGLGA